MYRLFQSSQDSSDGDRNRNWNWNRNNHNHNLNHNHNHNHNPDNGSDYEDGFQDEPVITTPQIIINDNSDEGSSTSSSSSSATSMSTSSSSSCSSTSSSPSPSASNQEQDQQQQQQEPFLNRTHVTTSTPSSSSLWYHDDEEYYRPQSSTPTFMPLHHHPGFSAATTTATTTASASASASSFNSQNEHVSLDINMEEAIPEDEYSLVPNELEKQRQQRQRQRRQFLCPKTKYRYCGLLRGRLFKRKLSHILIGIGLFILLLSLTIGLQNRNRNRNRNKNNNAAAVTTTTTTTTTPSPQDIGMPTTTSTTTTTTTSMDQDTIILPVLQDGYIQLSGGFILKNREIQHTPTLVVQDGKQLTTAVTLLEFDFQTVAKKWNAYNDDENYNYNNDHHQTNDENDDKDENSRRIIMDSGERNDDKVIEDWLASAKLQLSIQLGDTNQPTPITLYAKVYPNKDQNEPDKDISSYSFGGITFHKDETWIPFQIDFDRIGQSIVEIDITDFLRMDYFPSHSTMEEWKTVKVMIAHDNADQEYDTTVQFHSSEAESMTNRPIMVLDFAPPKTPSPSTSPAPSQMPSVSMIPTFSFAPSFRPSNTPTLRPTISPRPTFSPTISPAPTITSYPICSICPFKLETGGQGQGQEVNAGLGFTQGTRKNRLENPQALISNVSRGRRFDSIGGLLNKPGMTCGKAQELALNGELAPKQCLVAQLELEDFCCSADEDDGDNSDEETSTLYPPCALCQDGDGTNSGVLPSKMETTVVLPIVGSTRTCGEYMKRSERGEIPTLVCNTLRLHTSSICCQISV